MIKIKPFILIFLLLLTSPIWAQVTVFHSFEDYENKREVQFDDFVNWIHTKRNRSFKLVLLKNDKQVKVKVAKIWGFTYKDDLYVINLADNLPLKVVYSGNQLIYYENGPAHLQAIKNVRPLRETMRDKQEGYSSYISNTLLTRIHPIKERRFSYLMDVFPQHMDFIDCLDSNDLHYQAIRRCMKKYEEGELK